MGISALKVRIAEMTVDKPDSPEVAIRWKEDRGWLNAIPTAVAPDDVEPVGEYSTQPLLAHIALELPYGYLREAKPSLIFLPVRGDPLTNGFHDLLAQELDLVACPEFAVTIQKRAQRPAAPTNLRIFEDGAHPTYTTGQDIVVNWTPTSELRFGFNVAQNLECRADGTVLQVLTTGGTLKGEIAFAANTGPVTIPNAQLVALLGSETDFKLRAYYSLAGLRSLNFDEITVRKT